ncbi:MAG: cardiolipin synthase [Myxococcota bacterium]|jgi:cardiolipin synthase|nr:cardiolipin synthase [Myxococcota bacterium]
MDLGLILSLVSVSIVAVVSVWIVLEKRQPTSTLAWLLAVITLPYLGLLLYWLLGRRRVHRKTAFKSFMREAVSPNLPSLRETLSEHADSQRGQKSIEAKRHLLMLATRNTDEQPTVGNDVRILCDAAETYPALFEAIESAQHFVHVEYYIIQPDSVGERLRQALLRKAKEGLEVRLLMDGVGCWRLSSSWLNSLSQAGVKLASFLPPHLPTAILGQRWNFRNHRKLVVVDGRIGLMGGLNIGEEYEGRSKRLGYWRDRHLRIAGPAVHSLERVFIEDWHFATAASLDPTEHFPTPQMPGDELVQIIPSGPDRAWQSIHMQLFVAITTATRRCFITTPYFVPDESIRVALVTAARRGIDVRLIVPSRSDLRLVKWAGRSYYHRLLQAGVRIFEYQKGFLHAKTLVVDGNCGTVGSANMDIRSFRLNFELNAFIYGKDFARKLEAIFERDQADSKEITLEELDKQGPGYRFMEGLARLMSPLL